MVIPGVIEEDVNESFRGIHQHDRHQERNCARGIDRCHFDHTGDARFQINGPVKVQALPPAGPFERDRCVLGRPTAGWPHFVRGMHGISEDHSFIIAEIVEQIFVTVDKSLLFRKIELARHKFGLAIVHVVAPQELDQGRAAVADTIGFLDPLPHHGGRPRQRLRYPAFQRVLLRGRQFADAAFVTKVRQPAQTFLAVQLAPVTDRVIVEIENFRDLLAAHSVVEQQQCIRSSRQSRLGLPIPHLRDEVRSDARIEKTAANHARRRIAPPADGKLFFRQSRESGYIVNLA
jgi:hypothetical protein